MPGVVSLRGKLFELVELTAEKVTAIAQANGYDDKRFIAKFDGWLSELGPNMRVRDSVPLMPPRKKIEKEPDIVRAGLRGRPPSAACASKEPVTKEKKPKRKRPKSKYGFHRLNRARRELLIVCDDVARVAAAAAYYGAQFTPKRHFSVCKATIDGKPGARVTWVR